MVTVTHLITLGSEAGKTDISLSQLREGETLKCPTTKLFIPVS